jgi:glyoxylase-like metal-dependent hydrolase (beta-lactamase superfamily II)
MTQRPDVVGFYDKPTGTVSYVASCPATRRAAIIDPVLGFEPESGRASTAPADALIEHIDREGLKLDYVLETHVHADHLTAMAHVREKRGGRGGIGARVGVVQRYFARVFNVETEFTPDGRQFDELFADGAEFKLGEVSVRVIATPGHTPACVTYLIGDAAFIGDTLFMPDVGSARCDFPGGDAEELWRSVQRLYALPGETRVFVCHDYPPAGRGPRWETSIADERRDNMHLSAATTMEEFVARRRARDATLSMPRLILPSLQVNIRAGVLPAPEGNEIRYLRLPMNAL